MDTERNKETMNAHSLLRTTDPVAPIITQSTIDRKKMSRSQRLEAPLTRFVTTFPPQAAPTPHLSSHKPDTLPGCLQAFLSKNLGERITLKELSRFLGYSEKYASEFFRSQMGVCFSHHLKRLRITKATGMLSDHGLSISQIAESLGFSDAFAFSHFFKRAVGCSPTEFRKQQTVHAGVR
ncbi:MAG: hypothetical protein OJF47_001286 [Nitrospira sp.]|jgi:AraC-like DNA-binding protein|nr:MAG: hypothetical protein OJF47_001286 [Nitrospira sp.]